MGSFVLLFTIVITYFIVVGSHQPVAIRESLLLISTLDGTLHAVGQKSGIIKWSLAESPILQLPSLTNVSETLKRSLFLPDPKDGSLYLYNGLREDDDDKEALEKLPFTIAELVSTSPCRSSDGILYTGKKLDEWITIDAQTGKKVNVLNSETPMCPSPSVDGKKSHNLLLLGKSEFHLSIFDLKSKEKTWNLSYIDYSSSASVSIPQNAYELLHLTSSTSGRIATIDLSDDGNSLLWTHQFSSPIVAIYQFNEETAPVMRRVPFTTIGGPVNPKNIRQTNPLYPSLYIGEWSDAKSIYAISSLVDPSQTSLISSKSKKRLLLEGPDFPKDANTLEEKVLLLGYYEYPKYAPSPIVPQLQITQSPKNHLITNDIDVIPSTPNNWTHPSDKNNLFESVQYLLMGVGSIVVSIIIAVGFHFYFRKKPKNTSLNCIGKISFDPKNIIGRGCSGTCVYKGLFENKQQIAVKRVIADYFVLAEREIGLLRSFQHPHLVRYFATEADDLFRYIAIELADGTLADCVEKKIICDLSDTEILYQTCLGISHLHSLNVIHRDIKPQNILISQPFRPEKQKKVMISDFGVSKVLNSETSLSLTDISVTLKGTEGWIAPEIIKSKLSSEDFKPSKAVDIFSLGCLFYYVFSKGEHPFGDLLQRQARIIKGQLELSYLDDEESLCKKNVIQAMLRVEPRERPCIEAVIKHPMFWDHSKTLQFLQDVSDRIEKEANDSPVVVQLETGGLDVTKGDWRRHISIELQSDLRKFRLYKGSSVRDLTRAMRNKRHHYRELSPEVQKSLGSIPNQFVEYFTSRFPRLVIHSYVAMQFCKTEDILQSYYEIKNPEFNFDRLPRTGIKWFLKNTDKDNESISLKPNGVVTEDNGTLQEFNWKSCKRKGASPVKKLNVTSNSVPDLSPKFVRKLPEKDVGNLD